MPQNVHPDYAERVEKLAQEFARTAIERDRKGGTAKHERDLLRASGLLKISVPREHGGVGAAWASVLHIVRRIAEVDSSLRISLPSSICRSPPCACSPVRSSKLTCSVAQRAKTGSGAMP